MDSPSHISRVQTVVSISSTGEEEDMDDLGRLERENRELRRQVDVLMKGWSESRGERERGNEVRVREEDEKYEELVREMARLQTIVNKVR